MNTAFNSTCPLWGTPANKTKFHQDKDVTVYNSPRCGGEYEVTGSVPEDNLNNLSPQEKARLTTWLVDQRRQGTALPEIDTSVLKHIATMRPMSVADRRDRLLLCLLHKSPLLGEVVPILPEGVPINKTNGTYNSFEIMAWIDAIDLKEFYYVVKFAREAGLITQTTSIPQDIIITPKGYAHLEQLSGRNPDSAQAFVAMWFDDSMTATYEEGFKPAISDAGYKPLRIDRKEHVNKIDDEIIAEIRRSRFVVADFTSEPKKPRGGVYFEAGFAQGLGIPVIWTCRKDGFDDVHFDTRQFNHIVWATTADLRPKLKIRIEAVIGDGPLKGHKSE